MNTFKNKEFYLNVVLTFLVMVLIDWFIESGFTLFKGNTFYQTIENYKIPFSYLPIAFIIVYFTFKKQVNNIS